MSAGYLICLAASVVVILGARFVLGFLPLRRVAVRITPAAAGLRRQYTAAPLVVAVALVAVGVTTSTATADLYGRTSSRFSARW